MKKVIVRRAKESEIDWINAKYMEVNFKVSNYKKECIVIAEIDNQKAGLGRLVRIDDKNVELGGIYVFENFRGFGIADKIVGFLCTENHFENTTVWCLPFEKLKGFYSKFGFVASELIPPKEIKEKHEWCNVEGRYSQPVLLLSK